jgi:major membrane immunogen (membrane-anchored lipoprotein)
MFIRTSVLVISTALMLTACSSSDETSTPTASQSSDSTAALTGTPVNVEVTGEAG